MAQAVLQEEIIDAKQSLLQAKEAIIGRQWLRAEVYLDVAMNRLMRLLETGLLPENFQQELRRKIDNLQVVQRTLFRSRKTGQGQLLQQESEIIGNILSLIVQYEGHLKQTIWGQTT